MMKTTGDISPKLKDYWNPGEWMTIECKILIFKNLAISKIVHLALVKDITSSTIAQLEKNTKAIYLEKRKS